MKIVFRAPTLGLSGFAQMYSQIYRALKNSKRITDLRLETNDGLVGNPYSAGDYILLDGRLAHYWTAGGRWKKQIGLYSMMETDRLSESWVSACNTMDGILVPTQFNVDTYQKSGVIAPIKAIFPGVEPISKHYFDEMLGIEIDKSYYNFFAIGQWSPWCKSRKGWEELLEIYLTTFDGVKDVCLVIKPNLDWGFDPTPIVRHYKSKFAGKNPPKITVLKGKFNDDGMNYIFYTCDCLVQCTHGEGFGLDFLKAVQYNKPIVTTRFSSLPYILDGDKVFWVEPDGLENVPAEIVWHSNNAINRTHKWAKIDKVAMGKEMKKVYDCKIKEVIYDKYRLIDESIDVILDFVEGL